MTEDSQTIDTSHLRTISSRLSLPTAAAVVGCCMYTAYLIASAFPALFHQGFPLKKMLVFLLIFGVLAGFSYMYATLKRVRMDDQAIYISNYFSEITVPFSHITKVTGDRFVNVYFKDAGGFGGKIRFMPQVKLFAGNLPPIVRELRKLAGIIDQ